MESGTLLHTNINERSSVRPTTPCRGTQSNKADLCPMWNGASPPVLMVSGNRRWGVIPACGCRALVSVSESGQENTHKWPAGGQFGSGKLQNQPRTRPKEWAEMPLQSCPRCCSVQLAGGINPRSTIVLEWPSFDWAVSTVVCFIFFESNILQIFSDITLFWLILPSERLERNAAFLWMKKAIGFYFLVRWCVITPTAFDALLERVDAWWEIEAEDGVCGGGVVLYVLDRNASSLCLGVCVWEWDVYSFTIPPSSPSPTLLQLLLPPGCRKLP